MSNYPVTREVGACINCKHCHIYKESDAIDHSTRFSCTHQKVLKNKKKLDKRTAKFFDRCNEDIGPYTVTKEEVKKILSRDTVTCGTARGSEYCQFEWKSEKMKEKHQIGWDAEEKKDAS